jgi:dienelactone hydrolase
VAQQTLIRRLTGRVVAAVVGALLLVLGLGMLVRADDGLVRERASVDGVPVTVLRPPGEGPFPAVVVVHGFSGSGRLMDGIAQAFARDGWLAAVPDLRGHGANLRSLGDGRDDGLSDDIDVVRDWLAQRDDVQAAPALLGHSMGAGAVTRVGAEDPIPPPTVALSLPSADDLPVAASAPWDLLLLVGSAEQPRFLEAAETAGQRGFETAVVPGAEHISILFRTETLERSVQFLDAAVGRTSAGPVAPDQRMAAVGLAYLGAALLFWPVSAWLLPVQQTRVRGRTQWWPVWLVVPLAAALAGAVLAVLPGLGEVVPLLVGGYLAAALLLTGTLMLLLARRWDPPALRPVLAGLGLGGYAALTVAVPAQLGWAEVSLAGPRGWSALALCVAFGLYALGETLVAWRPGVTYGRVVLARLLLAAVLVALGLSGLAPGFLLLLAPVMAVVLPWFGAYGVRVTRLSGSPLAGALTQALPLGLLVAIATPLG